MKWNIRIKHFTFINSALVLLFFLTGNFVFSQENKREMVVKEGDQEFTLKLYYMCFLKKGTVRGQDSATAAQIQAGHLDHLNKLHEMGKALIVGPFGDDGDIRGIVIFDTETKEEAEKLQAEDPAVKSGRLVAEIRPWWAAKGSVLK